MTLALPPTLPAEAPPAQSVATGLWITAHPGFACRRRRLTLPQPSARFEP